MGDIRHKIAPHFLHLAGLQDELLQIAAKGIERSAQIGDFIIPVDGYF